MMTKEQCSEILLDIYHKQGKLTYKNIQPHIHHRVVKRHFGKLSDFIALYELSKTNEQALQRTITDEDCLREIQRLYSKFGKVTNTILKEHGTISGDTISRKFGSLYEAYNLAGIDLVRGQRKLISEGEILLSLQELQEKFGYVSKPLLEKHTPYSPKVITRLYGSFDEMYKKTGFKRSPSGYIPTDKELISDLHRLKDEYGVVTQDIIEKYGIFSTTCYKDRFKSTNNAYLSAGLETRQPGKSITATWTIGKFEDFLGEFPELEKRFDWLRNPKNNYLLPIDAYFPNHNIAIEYNGPQHYEIDSIYVKTQEELEYRQWLDSIKYQLIREQNIHLIVIHYLDKITIDYIKSKLSVEE